MTDHTPGPWEVFTIASSAGVSYRIHAGDNDIAHIPMPWSGDGSNARLIAAAPDLLEALEECLREHGGYTIRGECERRARAALKRAKGG